jgi:hypothetical protein
MHNFPKFWGGGGVKKILRGIGGGTIAYQYISYAQVCKTSKMTNSFVTFLFIACRDRLYYFILVVIEGRMGHL